MELPLPSRVKPWILSANEAEMVTVRVAVEALSADGMALRLVNTNQVEAREVVVQGGAYGEHQFLDAAIGGGTTTVDGPFFTVRLAPGAGVRLELGMQRYANQPTFTFPWDRKD